MTQHTNIVRHTTCINCHAPLETAMERTRGRHLDCPDPAQPETRRDFCRETMPMFGEGGDDAATRRPV